MQFKYLILSLFLALQTISFALPVIIEGKSSAGDNYVFRVYLKKDALSGLEYLADQQRPDKDGHFSLGFELREIQEIKIEVGLQSVKFFAIPGETYYLNFSGISINDQNVFLPQKPLDVIFEKEDMLNIVIDGFNYEYQRFLEKEFITLIKYHDKKLFNSFCSDMYKKLQESPLKDSLSFSFTNNYIEYKLVELSLIAGLEANESLGIQYLTNKDILLNNPAYISFFKKYFDKYLLSRDYYYDLRRLINQGPPSAKLIDKLGQDPVLLKEKLRELVLLNSLKQVFYDTDFNQYALNDLFTELENKSKFSSNKTIAKNLKISLNRFAKGSSLPDFKLKNLSGETKKLSSYRNKKTYLMFISPDCETCEADIRLLKARYKEINNQINLVTIYVGYNHSEATKWAKNQNANWDFLWFQDNFNLLNEYKIKTFPKYLIIDEDSRLLNYFPPKPRENLFTTLEAYKKQAEAKNKKNTKGKSDIFRN